MRDKTKREWAYVQNPKVYCITCDLCNGDNIEWSEYDQLIWCYDCEKDTKGTEGIFSGPINVGTCGLLGMCFNQRNLETGEISTLEDEMEKTNENISR